MLQPWFRHYLIYLKFHVFALLWQCTIKSKRLLFAWITTAYVMNGLFQNTFMVILTNTASSYDTNILVLTDVFNLWMWHHLSCSTLSSRQYCVFICSTISNIYSTIWKKKFCMKLSVSNFSFPRQFKVHSVNIYSSVIICWVNHFTVSSHEFHLQKNEHNTSTILFLEHWIVPVQWRGRIALNESWWYA